MYFSIKTTLSKNKKKKNRLINKKPGQPKNRAKSNLLKPCYKQLLGITNLLIISNFLISINKKRQLLQQTEPIILLL